MQLKHIATVNNTKILVVLTIFASFITHFALFCICDTYDKRAVIILYRKGGIYEMELKHSQVQRTVNEMPTENTSRRFYIIFLIAGSMKIEGNKEAISKLVEGESPQDLGL